jgi:hypothetical protein
VSCRLLLAAVATAIAAAAAPAVALGSAIRRSRANVVAFVAPR